MNTAPSTKRTLTRRGFLAGGAAFLAAAGGGTAWALDRFVIEHPEVSNASSEWESATSAGGTVTGTSYSGSNGAITITKVEQGSGTSKVTYFVADLLLSSATSLRAAFANDTFGENIVAVPSKIAQDNGAIFAINGDYYGFRDTGIVIRNGVAFRDQGARQGLVLNRDGSLALYDETSTDAARLIADGAWQTLSFGPGLVSGGAVVDGIDEVEVDTNVGNHSIQGTQPRTGIGLIGTNHLVAVVVDGRSTGYSVGVSMTEFAQIFVGLGAQVAYNLDGGGSSTMYFNGSVTNNPLGKGQERGTSDILYVAG